MNVIAERASPTTLRDRSRRWISTDGTTTDYFYNNTVLMGFTDSNSNALLFSYDAAGRVQAVSYNGTYYYYLRNGQGDIVKLIDGSGNAMAEYAYDSWGKPLSCTGTLATTLGALNPFRYRGYVYDEETGRLSHEKKSFDHHPFDTVPVYGVWDSWDDCVYCKRRNIICSIGRIS